MQTDMMHQACEGKPDPVELFLHRAHARLLLLQAGEIDSFEAISGLLPALNEVAQIACPSCGFCEPRRAA